MTILHLLEHWMRIDQGNDFKDFVLSRFILSPLEEMHRRRKKEGGRKKEYS
jgi:hypothetical protein